MKITLTLSERNEATAEPYWLILDPRQMLRIDPDMLASMVTGPFFSRESAQLELDSHRYRYGKRAVVYCMSGYRSDDYRRAVKAAAMKGDPQC